MAKNQGYDEWIACRLKAIRPFIGLSFFWVVDGCAEPDFLKLVKNIRDTEAWPLYMNTYLDEVQDAGPWFIRHKEGSGLVDTLFKLIEHTPLGFLTAVRNGDEENLFYHFQSILECRLPDGKDGIFRFYDPRILYGIHSFADQNFMKLVCGPALEIHFWEPGRSIPLSFKAAPEDKTAVKPPIRLTQELIDHLWREAQVHTIVNTLGGTPGMRLRKLELPQAYAFVDDVRKNFNGTQYVNNRDVAFAVALALEENMALG